MTIDFCKAYSVNMSVFVKLLPYKTHAFYKNPGSVLFVSSSYHVRTMFVSRSVMGFFAPFFASKHN